LSPPAIEKIREALKRMHHKAIGEDDRAYMSIPADPERDADLILSAAIDELELLRKREADHDAARVAMDRLFAGVDGGLPIADAVKAAIGDTMIERAIAVLLGDPLDREFVFISKAFGGRTTARGALQIKIREIESARSMGGDRLAAGEIAVLAAVVGAGPDTKTLGGFGAALVAAATAGRRNDLTRRINDLEFLETPPRATQGARCVHALTGGAAMCGSMPPLPEWPPLHSWITEAEFREIISAGRAPPANTEPCHECYRRIAHTITGAGGPWNTAITPG
jgi:hypothetical protein